MVGFCSIVDLRGILDGSLALHLPWRLRADHIAKVLREVKGTLNES